MANGKDIIRKLHELTTVTHLHAICGTHEAAIARNGIRSVLPKNLKIVMGPGCPSVSRRRVRSMQPLNWWKRDCIVATYGDLLSPGLERVPGSSGGDVRVVQGVHKAVEIANSTDKGSFISVGFEDDRSPTLQRQYLPIP